MKKICIIILNYNGWKDTIECLESLLELNYKNYQIVLVDNCSTDDSIYQLEQWAIRNLKLYTFIGQFGSAENYNEPMSHIDQISHFFINAETNGGYSSGNNIGIKFSMANLEPDYLWILNNDTSIPKDSLSILLSEIETVEKTIKLGPVGCKLLYYHNRDTIQCLGGSTYNAFIGFSRQLYNGYKDVKDGNLKKLKIDYISGSCMLVSRDFIEDVGLMNEEYFLFYEEIDWCLRGKKKGYSIDYFPKAYIFHKEGSTIGANNQNNDIKSKLSDFYYIRSKLRFTRNYYSIMYLFGVYISIILSITMRLYRAQYDRIFMILKLVRDPNINYAQVTKSQN